MGGVPAAILSTSQSMKRDIYFMMAPSSIFSGINVVVCTDCRVVVCTDCRVVVCTDCRVVVCTDCRVVVCTDCRSLRQ
jgi:hypothetical protein